MRPHRQQPTRLPCPWDSPGKNTGVGCHCLLQCIKVKSEHEVAQSCPTLRDPMDCSLSGSSIRGVFQARVNHTSWYLPKGVENLCLMHMDVYSRFINNFQKLGVTKMSFSKWMDKQTVIQPDRVIFLVLKRDELLKHEKTWRKFQCILLSERSQCKKVHTVKFQQYDILKNIKLWRQWKDQWLPRFRREGEMNMWSI